MSQRAAIDGRFWCQRRDRACQVSDGISDLARCRVIIVRHCLCGGDRCLQRFQAFFGIVAIKVTICGLDQCFQFCLRHDLPQFLGCLGHRFVRCFQLISVCFRIVHCILRCRHSIYQRLYLGRTESLCIIQDILIDEVDRGLHIFSQRVYAFISVQRLHRFAQIEQGAHDSIRRSIIRIIKQ